MLISYNKLKHVTSNKNELHELSKKVKAMSTKVLTKDLINLVFLMEYLYQLKNTLNIFVALLRLILGNLMECQKKILKI